MLEYDANFLMCLQKTFAMLNRGAPPEPPFTVSETPAEVPVPILPPPGSVGSSLQWVPATPTVLPPIEVIDKTGLLTRELPLDLGPCPVCGFEVGGGLLMHIQSHRGVHPQTDLPNAESRLIHLPSQDGNEVNESNG